MNHFEEYIAEWYDTIPEGGGTAASPWKIEWNDVPYKERDTRPLSRLKVLGAMKEVLFNGTPTQRAAVYIHIPFCRLSCTYCSFFKKKGDNKAQHEYVELLLKELESLSDKPYVKKSKISAVFFWWWYTGHPFSRRYGGYTLRYKENVPFGRGCGSHHGIKFVGYDRRKDGRGHSWWGNPFQLWHTVI